MALQERPELAGLWAGQHQMTNCFASVVRNRHRRRIMGWIAQGTKGNIADWYAKFEESICWYHQTTLQGRKYDLNQRCGAPEEYLEQTLLTCGFLSPFPSFETNDTGKVKEKCKFQ